jgi:hypothetical protein
MFLSFSLRKQRDRSLNKRVRSGRRKERKKKHFLFASKRHAERRKQRPELTEQLGIAKHHEKEGNRSNKARNKIGEV